MSHEEQRAEVVCYWWAKAKESLASARRELVLKHTLLLARCTRFLEELRPLISLLSQK